MKAIDLVEQVPLVGWDTDAVTAVQTLATHRMAGLVVADANGVPEAMIPSPQLLRLAIPQYVLDDPQLAHVYDEQAAGELIGRLRGHRLGELRQRKDLKLRSMISVLPEDTVMEIAAAMCDEDSALVLVRERDGTYHGVITLSRLTAAVLELGGAGTAGSGRTLSVDLADHADPPGQDAGDDAG
jgi:CBS domain-containing protein